MHEAYQPTTDDGRGPGSGPPHTASVRAFSKRAYAKRTPIYCQPIAVIGIAGAVFFGAPMFFRLIIVASIVLNFLLAQSANAQTQLDDVLKPIRAKYGLPALAAAVVKDGSIIAIGAVGTRVLGTEIPVAVDDRFHIGSDTKAMTALARRQVDR